ncbi:MAG: C_GCAxxG_C_C family protein [Firmicutes bacterium]|nr:C_GCAxxG_C_C family protein [Bacillota bacterium]
MDRKQQALELHKNKYNCAQSLACSFCHVMGADPVQTFKQAEALGFGMGSMGTCGVLTGMALVVGMKISDGNLDDPQTKKDCYKMMRTLTEEFQEKYGSVTCSELKSADNRKSCDELIAYGAELLDKHLLGL